MKHEREFFEAAGLAWEAYVQFMHSPPRLMMRRKVDGSWQYREPTKAEAQEYRETEAW